MSYTNILVAYDGSETGKKALLKGKELTVLNEKAKLTVIHAWKFINPGYDPYSLKEMNRCLQQLALDIVQEAKNELKDFSNEKEVQAINGHAASSIVKFAKEHHVDLIVIGSRGLSGVERFFLGSVSFHVIQKAPCDVLVIK